MLVPAIKIKPDNSFYDYHEKKTTGQKTNASDYVSTHSHIRPAESHLVSSLLLVVTVDLVNVSLHFNLPHGVCSTVRKHCIQVHLRYFFAKVLWLLCGSWHSLVPLSLMQTTNNVKRQKIINNFLTTRMDSKLAQFDW